ncbi:MAG: hypothetical protein HOJ54_05425 [Phycisphaerae bacterium]|nr:hypothetical protein [Phycisphaerae bacterium]
MVLIQTCAIIGLSFGFAAGSATVTPTDLAAQLNVHESVSATADETCWQVLAPPLRALSVVPDTQEPLTLRSIWPGMADWKAVSAWALSGADLGKAIETAANRPSFGLKYGRESVEAGDIAINMFVDLGHPDERLLLPTFPYLESVRRMVLWTAAETYRLAEAGEAEAGLTLLLDELMVLRKLADREFQEEKQTAIHLVNEGLEFFRGVMYRYLDDLSPAFLKRLAYIEIASLRPGRVSLFMPENDRLLCEALLANAFDPSLGTPDMDEFAAVFTDVQTVDRPLQRFGARNRWEALRRQHDSLETSKERLHLIFDDWWRRWRSDDMTQMGSLILDQQSQFELLNVGRFAAIDAVIHDMKDLFDARARLLVEVNATAAAAGIAGYRQDRGVYPKEMRIAFGITLNKSFVVDEYALIADGYRPWFVYRYISKRRELDVGKIRVWLEPGTGLLYSAGRDGIDSLGKLHVDEQGRGDLIIWPPPLELVREQHGTDAKD